MGLYFQVVGQYKDELVQVSKNFNLLLHQCQEFYLIACAFDNLYMQSKWCKIYKNFRFAKNYKLALILSL